MDDDRSNSKRSECVWDIAEAIEKVLNWPEISVDADLCKSGEFSDRIDFEACWLLGRSFGALPARSWTKQ